MAHVVLANWTNRPIVVDPGSEVASGHALSLEEVGRTISAEDTEPILDQIQVASKPPTIPTDGSVFMPQGFKLSGFKQRLEEEQEGLEAGSLGSWDSEKLGGWEAERRSWEGGRLGSWEAERLRGWEAWRLGG